MKNTIITGIIAVIIGVALGLVIGYYASQPNKVSVQGISTSDSTFGSQKIASAQMQSGTSTLVSLFNGTNDRFITETYCINTYASSTVGAQSNGTGISAGTSTTPYTVWGSGTATSTVLTDNVYMATSTATSTATSPQIPGWFVQPIATSSAVSGLAPASVQLFQSALWPSGTYFNFVATTTFATVGGQCGAKYYQL